MYCTQNLVYNFLGSVQANALAQKLSKVPFFSDQGFENYLNSRKNTKVTPDTYKNYLEIIKGAI